MKSEKPKILIMASVASTLWVFYRGLIQQLSDAPYDVTIVADDDYNLSRFRDEYRSKIMDINIKRKVSPFHDIDCILRLYRFMRKEKFDLVHAHTPKAGMIGMIASFLARVPVRIYTLHGLPLETIFGLKRRIFWMVERLTFKCATNSLIVSSSLARRAMELKLLKVSDFQILGHGSACGVDRTRFNSAGKNVALVHKKRRELNIPPDAIVIGFVGRITPDKGVNDLLEVYEKISSYNDKLFLLLVGDYDATRGESMSEYQKRIDQHPRIKHVSFVEEIVPYYYIMDLLVLPSKREGFGYALLEAAACGLPTIATKTTGCVSAIVENITGLLVDVGDIDGLKNAMLKLIHNPQLRRQLGDNAENRVQELFDSKRLIQEHINLYKDLLK